MAIKITWIKLGLLKKKNYLEDMSLKTLVGEPKRAKNIKLKIKIKKMNMEAQCIKT
jgi:hypothetical protein